MEIAEIDYNVAMQHYKEYAEVEAMEKTIHLLSLKYGFEFKKYRRLCGMDNEKTEYICDDRPMPVCQEVDNMTDYEVELEFQKRFAGISEQR